MGTLRLVLGDQLTHTLASLRQMQSDDCILMCEVMQEATYVKHHPKKIAFLFAAMRHFASELTQMGHCVRYVKLDDDGNTGNLTDEVERALVATQAKHLVCTQGGEYRITQMMKEWQHTFAQNLNVKVEILEDDRFLCSHEQFQKWAGGKTQLRMEYFYREMRRRYGILVEIDGSPVGGQWNYDKENRKPPAKGLFSPKRIRHKKSDPLKDVLKLVKERFSHHFGNLEPFHYALTHEQATMELHDFIENILPHFGDYQDAMVKGEPYLYHSLLSSYINAGLLCPLEVCLKAQEAYVRGHVPLNCAEGFIRQILGWREYVRGIYWLFMPHYGQMNFLEAKEPLPALYWGAQTHMSCMREVIEHTHEHAYSHHIQRLMVTGNFALLAGLDVEQVQEWYLAVYSDAYEWVEMPNTLGMALYGDGGKLGSKPYAASGKYIDKMSDYCKSCVYSPALMTEEQACPFNALYWDFLVRHRRKLEGNQRLPYVYSTWDKFTSEKKNAIREKAQQTLERMRAGIL